MTASLRIAMANGPIDPAAATVARAVVEALDDESLDELARLLAPRLVGITGGLVDAATLARHLGVSRDWVYAHKQTLGGRKLGDGPRPRWRFDLQRARAAVAGRTMPHPVAPSQRRRKVKLLPIRPK